MRVNCLSCGHTINLGEAYEEGYEGAIRCSVCAALLEIKTEHGDLRSVRMTDDPGRTVST